MPQSFCRMATELSREMAHTNIGEKLLMDFAAACSELANMEKNPKLDGRFMTMFLSPKSSR